MLVSDNISTRELRELLVPTHLHYDSGTQSLRVRAFAEILTKVLYSLKRRRASFETLKREVAQIAMVKNIRTEDVCAGLRFLEERGKVAQEEESKRWFLTESGKRKVVADIDSANRKTEAILDNYFGTKIDRDVLRRWFRNASAHFFGKYSDLWARTLYRRDLTSAPSAIVLEQTLYTSIKKYGLKQDSDELVRGFRSFIESYRDPLVNEQIWFFAQAMLSARLITAAVGPDPITIKEFRNANVFLDTNVLFLIALEDSSLACSLAELASSLQDINSTIHILEDTNKEYGRVIAHKHAEMQKAISRLPFDVIADAKDDFLRAAIARGCKDAESVRAFFESIKDPIKLFNRRDVSVVLEKDGLPATAAKMAAFDTKRHAEIAAEWSKVHRVPKTPNSITHDAALDGAVEHLRKKGNRAWIVTRDTTMQNLSNRWTGNENFPIWLSLDALIQILALESTGPSHDPANYAPLLSALVESDMQPGDGAYQIEDLNELIDLEERARELDKSEIEMFANKIAKLRMSGKPRDHNELQLEIRRTFNRKKVDYGAKVRSLQEELASKEEDIEKESRNREMVFNALVGRLEAFEFAKILLLLFFAALVLVGIGLVLIFFGLRLPLENNPILVPVLISFGITEILIPTVKWLIPGFLNARKRAHKQARKKAHALITD